MDQQPAWPFPHKMDQGSDDERAKMLKKLLQDFGHMAFQTLDKTTAIWDSFRNNNSDQVENQLEILVDKVCTNLTSFKNDLHECRMAAKRKLDTANGDLQNHPVKKRLRLSLKKENEAPEEPLTVAEQPKTNGDAVVNQVIDSDTEDQIIRGTKKAVAVIKSDDSDADSDDSERTVVLGYLGVEGKELEPAVFDDKSAVFEDKSAVFNDKSAVFNGNSAAFEDNSATFENNSAIIEKNSAVFSVESTANHNNDDDEFDLTYFDTSEEKDATNNEAELKPKAEVLNEGTNYSNIEFDFDEYPGDIEKIENKALLQCLLANENGTEDDLMRPRTIEELAQLAMKELEDDEAASLSTSVNSSSEDIDSDVSLSSYESSSSDSPPKNRDESSSSSSQSEEDSPEVQEVPVKEQSQVLVNISRIDDMNDAEFDRLCNMNNLDKKRCKKAISNVSKVKKTPAKRGRKLSTTSTSSDSSTSSESLTPDIDESPEFTVSNEKPVDENQFLAEMACGELQNSDSSTNTSDSDNDSSVDEKKESKKAKKKEAVSETVEVAKSETISEQETSTKSTWRNDPLLTKKLWTSEESSTSSSSDDEDMANAVKVRRERKKNKSLLKRVKSPTIISDTDSSDVFSEMDSDIEFISESDATDTFTNASGGRRNIRSVMRDEELTEATQRAKSDEYERVQRLEARKKDIELIQSQTEDFVLDADVTTGEPLVTVNRILVQKLKEHQKTGVEFMWKACYESVEMIKTSKGTGCILAHCMGLGKTLQVITLIHTLFTHPITQTRHVLVICPISTISNWRNEFKMAFQPLPKEDTNINLYFLVKQTLTAKYHTIDKWYSKGGVLLMSYEGYVAFTKEKENRPARISEQQRKSILEALVNPGPDLIVCDEGHFIKNSKAHRSQALMNIHTKRRIVLTGTPLQNNLMEYYWMIRFIKKDLLGTAHEYRNRFANPITNGQYGDSTPNDIKLMKKRTHVLNELLKASLDRKESCVLGKYLPEIHDYTLFVKMDDIQTQSYVQFIESVRETLVPGKGHAFFSHFLISKLICLHPYTVKKYYDKCENSATKKVQERETIALNPEDDPDQIRNVARNKDWFQELYTDEVLSNIQFGTKLSLIIDIIDETIRNKDKILIFSTSLDELDCVEHFLQLRGTKECREWKTGIDYFRLDGRVDVTERSSRCDAFNDPNNTKAKVFLMTQKVGGLGLNLTGANRVILISSNFNPSVDTQSIFRVYRFGQTKPCFIYRLLTIGTMEEKMYQRCCVKLSVASTVIDKKHISRRFPQEVMATMYQHDFTAERERPIPLVPKDKLLGKLLQISPYLFSYEQHGSLFISNPDEELNDEEKKSAWDEFNSIDEVATRPLLPNGNNPQLFPNGLDLWYQNQQNQANYAFNRDKGCYTLVQGTNTNDAANGQNYADTLAMPGPSQSRPMNLSNGHAIAKNQRFPNGMPKPQPSSQIVKNPFVTQHIANRTTGNDGPRGNTVTPAWLQKPRPVTTVGNARVTPEMVSKAVSTALQQSRAATSASTSFQQAASSNTVLPQKANPVTTSVQQAKAANSSFGPKPKGITSSLQQPRPATSSSVPQKPNAVTQRGEDVTRNVGSGVTPEMASFTNAVTTVLQQARASASTNMSFAQATPGIAALPQKPNPVTTTVQPAKPASSTLGAKPRGVTSSLQQSRPGSSSLPQKPNAVTSAIQQSRPSMFANTSTQQAKPFVTSSLQQPRTTSSLPQKPNDVTSSLQQSRPSTFSNTSTQQTKPKGVTSSLQQLRPATSSLPQKPNALTSIRPSTSANTTTQQAKPVTSATTTFHQKPTQKPNPVTPSKNTSGNGWITSAGSKISASPMPKNRHPRPWRQATTTNGNGQPTVTPPTGDVTANKPTGLAQYFY